MRERFKLSVSVFMLLEKGDSLLLIQRANTGWMDGLFSLPAGAIDGNETLESAICREVKEEVDLTVLPQNVKLAHIIHCLTEGSEWIGVFFVTQKWSGKEKVNEPNKHSEIRWQRKSELPIHTIPYVKQAIEKYMQKIPFSTYGWE